MSRVGKKDKEVKESYEDVAVKLAERLLDLKLKSSSLKEKFQLEKRRVPKTEDTFDTCILSQKSDVKDGLSKSYTLTRDGNIRVHEMNKGRMKCQFIVKRGS